jgi:hypothetical protein
MTSRVSPGHLPCTNFQVRFGFFIVCVLTDSLNFFQSFSSYVALISGPPISLVLLIIPPPTEEDKEMSLHSYILVFDLLVCPNLHYVMLLRVNIYFTRITGLSNKSYSTQRKRSSW